jgi:inorganic pyrophosphatase
MTDPAKFDQIRSHPWHGLSPGIDPPSIVKAYIENPQFPFLEYEIDIMKASSDADRQNCSLAS